MILEVREVGRKTPGDGRLEITPASYRRLRLVGDGLLVRVGNQQAVALLELMPCTCARGAATGTHEHAFVRSDLLRSLTPGETCVLDLSESGELSVAGPHSLDP